MKGCMRYNLVGLRGLSLLLWMFSAFLCRAMIITPDPAKIQADPIDTAIMNRQASSLSPEDVQPAKDYGNSSRIDALKFLKGGDFPPAENDPNAIEVDDSNGMVSPLPPSSLPTVAAGLGLLIPIGCIILALWITRKALVSRRREKKAMLQGIPAEWITPDPDDPAKVLAPPIKTPTFTMREFLLFCDKLNDAHQQKMIDAGGDLKQIPPTENA